MCFFFKFIYDIIIFATSNAKQMLQGTDTLEQFANLCARTYLRVKIATATDQLMMDREKNARFTKNIN